MSFESIVKKYVAELDKSMVSAKAAGQHTPELSYRPELHRFFIEMSLLIDRGGNITTIIEPKNQEGAGRPDWMFYNASSMGVYGYVEAKGLNSKKTLSLGKDSNQIRKYLDLGHILVVTDGIDFAFFFPDGSGHKEFRTSLYRKPFSRPRTDRFDPGLLSETEEQFRKFFKDVGPWRCNEVQLISRLAFKAKILSQSAENLVDLDPNAAFDEKEKSTIVALNELKALFETHHDKRLETRKAFADFVAQVLVFGLLYARLAACAPEDPPPRRGEKIKGFWKEIQKKKRIERLKPFRALVELLNKELFSLGPLGMVYQDCLMMLAHAELIPTPSGDLDFHKLFECFLDRFDPETKFDFGAFYTPGELAKYAVGFVKTVVRKEMPEVSLYEEGNRLIDPCCGTGTYLEQLVIQSDDLADRPSIVGFEILPAPYALAHYRLSMIESSYGTLRNVEIVLTNTLSDELEKEIKTGKPDNLVEDEQETAKRLSRSPITLVIGNPPSSDRPQQFAGVDFSIINELLEDFRPPKELRRGRENVQKQTKNLFMQFLRWSCQKILETGDPGILSVILPYSFADAASYEYARKWITSCFDKIWVLDIDDDLHTGVRTDNLFQTIQGRLLLTAIVGIDDKQDGGSQIAHGSIMMLSKADKLAELSRDRSDDESLNKYSPVSDPGEDCLFRPPTTEYDESIYELFWPLCPEGNGPAEGEKYIFERHCSGVKLAPSALFVHASKELLHRRTRDIADLGKNVDDLLVEWFSGQDKPPRKAKITENLQRGIGELFSGTGAKETLPIRKYSFRPFLENYVLLSEPLLRWMTSLDGGGTRYRPEVVAAFASRKTFGIAVAPAPKDQATSLHRFASFCWNLPDNDLCRRGNAHVFCNRFPEYLGRGEDRNLTSVSNVNPVLVKEVSEGLDITEDKAGDAILYYVYAVLCSDAYLNKFTGALFKGHGRKTWPRIPISSDQKLFESIATKGKQLAILENYAVEVDIKEDFEKFEALFKMPFSLKNQQVDAEGGELTLSGDGISLTLAPIRKEILSFMISGYSVVGTWLKFNSHRYTRTAFDHTQYRKLLALLHRIGRQIELIGGINSDVSRLLSVKSKLLRDP